MAHDEIRVERFMDAILVEAEDKAGQDHRWWFDETDAGRLVLCSEIIEADGAEAAPTIRHYVPQPEMTVPEVIHDALDEYGFEDSDVVTLEGQEL